MKDEMARTFSISDKFMTSTLQNYEEVYSSLSGEMGKYAQIHNWCILFGKIITTSSTNNNYMGLGLIIYSSLDPPPLSPPINVQLLMLRIESVKGRKSIYFDKILVIFQNNIII